MSQGLNVKHRIRSRVGVGSAWFRKTCEVKQVKNRIRGRVIGQGSKVKAIPRDRVEGQRQGQNQDQGQESKVRVRIRDSC